MLTTVGRDTGFEMADGTVRERRSLLHRERASHKLILGVPGESWFLARREMAYHALHDFFLN